MRITSSLFLVLVAGLFGVAPPAGATPDTLVVPTFSFDDIETRRATFEFPTAGRTWQRIRMAYTLKCDEATVADEYPCGEWDVVAHTLVHVHTGRMDSTLNSHPSFKVEGASPDAFAYSTEPRHHIFTDWSDPDRPRADDRYLRFDGTDCVIVPPAALAGIDSSLTLSFWARGGGDQPRNDHVIEAGSTGGRVVNIHLPWGTGTVYWDCGGRLGGNNNRLAKDARPGEFKGRWNHWAFTKDTRSGEMVVYLNGDVWHRAGNMTKDIPPIDAFTIGANSNRNGGWYSGDLDDVRIWDVALDGETIAAWRHVEVTPEHPAYDHLRAEYRFDDPTRAGRDSSPHQRHGESFGQPQGRPHGLMSGVDFKPGPRAVLRSDSIPAPRLSVQLYENPDEPETPTRVMDVWPAFDTHFDGMGRVLEDAPVDDPDSLQQEIHEWYGEPFEVIETYELGRFITPYGKRLDLGEAGFTWMYDVTDYAPLLVGDVDLQAGNTQALLDLKFIFVEGTPPRDVRSIQNLWPMADHRYRALADDSELAPVVVRADPAASGFMLRSRISGHGHAGPRNCCEWDAKEHMLLVGGLERYRWTVWRDCGMNPVHPQGGTWQFDRAGWCPGTFADTHDHELTPWMTPGDEVALDYDVQDYDPDIFEDSGRFLLAHQLFMYGPPNLERDAAVVDVIAPTRHGEYRRLNPISDQAVVRIRNLGAETLHTLDIEYGLEGGKSRRESWRGDLPFLATELVELPAADWSRMDDGARFTVEVSRPNGETDLQPGNDRISVPVAAPHVLPAEFLVEVEAPGFGRAADNRWSITDRDGRIRASRETYEREGTYRDPVHLDPGAYTFEFFDSEEDGLIRHWWLRGSDPERMGENGAVRILAADESVLLDLGYDFAEKRTLRFFVGEVY